MPLWRPIPVVRDRLLALTTTIDASPWAERLGGAERLRAVGDPLEGLQEGLKGVVWELARGMRVEPERLSVLAEAHADDLPALCRVASEMRDSGKGRTVTFSPKVFIPLTRMCRDFCGYCTFRQSPDEADRLYMSPDEVLAVARAGERLGCAEALFTLGERPEQRYPEAKAWLSQNGFGSTLEYLAHCCSLVLEETTLLPHPNPGTMSRHEMGRLKDVSASMGIMVESTSERLCAPGGPHEFAPSKRPRARLKTLETAGELGVPFTTGVLVGIGDTREERIEAMVEIAGLHQRHGHIQEVIIQNFRAKPDTAMAEHEDAEAEEMLWSVAMARLVLGPAVNLQVPPNLSQRDYPMYLQAGINDWGGVSPLTIDYVNPEAPWPQIADLERHTGEQGFILKPRFPVYPEFFLDKPNGVSSPVAQRLRDMADEDGYVKGGTQRYANAHG